MSWDFLILGGVRFYISYLSKEWESGGGCNSTKITLVMVSIEAWVNLLSFNICNKRDTSPMSLINWKLVDWSLKKKNLHIKCNKAKLTSYQFSLQKKRHKRPMLHTKFRKRVALNEQFTSSSVSLKLNITAKWFNNVAWKVFLLKNKQIIFF